MSPEVLDTMATYTRSPGVAGHPATEVHHFRCGLRLVLVDPKGILLVDRGRPGCTIVRSVKISCSQNVANHGRRSRRTVFKGIAIHVRCHGSNCGELIALLADKTRLTRQRSLAEARNAKYDELVDIVEAEIDAGRPAVYRLAEIEGERAEVSRTLVDLDRQEAETDAQLGDLVGLVPSSTRVPPLAERDWSGAALEFHTVRVADAVALAGFPRAWRHG